MKFEEKINQIESRAEKYAPAVRLAASIRNAVVSCVILGAIIFFECRFHVVEMIATAETNEPIVKPIALAILLVMIIGPLSFIVTCIFDLLAVKDPYGPLTIRVEYVKQIMHSLPFVIAGLLFGGTGVYVIVVYLVNFNFGGIAGGIITGLMGLTALVMGGFSIVSDTRQLIKYLKGDLAADGSRIMDIGSGDTSRFDGMKDNLIACIKDRLLYVLVGGVFALVPLLMIGTIISSPDMDLLPILFLLFMGLVFGVIGVGIVYIGIKPFIEDIKNGTGGRLSKEEEEEYKDLSLK